MRTIHGPFTELASLHDARRDDKTDAEVDLRIKTICDCIEADPPVPPTNIRSVVASLMTAVIFSTTPDDGCRVVVADPNEAWNASPIAMIYPPFN